MLFLTSSLIIVPISKTFPSGNSQKLFTFLSNWKVICKKMFRDEQNVYIEHYILLNSKKSWNFRTLNL